LLRDFLREQAGRRFALGQHDCGLIIADWIERVTGRDPAAPVRGRYHDEASLIALAGPLGLPRLFDRLLREAGLMRTDDPQLGDVAILSVMGTDPRGAIRTASGYVMAAPEGLAGIRNLKGVRVLQAWALSG